MKIIALILLTTLFLTVFPYGVQGDSENPRIWAVVVAGSSGWGNYRHQASACHAYHVLHNHGIPEERIVVMMYDDIAYNPKNPTPGIIVNHPGGPDVYKGVPHDYTGMAVTPHNFMAVLKGDKRALRGVGSGKVVDSGPNDHVFVYFVDHGGPGIIAFPHSLLSATEMQETIRYLHQNNKYKKMVLYIEACYSGSMFQNLLPNNINVFVTTSANAHESAWSCCYDRKRKTFVSSTYSITWLEDSDKENLLIETLNKQYEIVKNATTRSHVSKYGDMTMGKLHLSEFQGSKPAPPITYSQAHNAFIRNGDAELEVVKQQISNASSPDERSKWEQTLEKMNRNRKFLSDKVKAVVDNLALEDPHIASLWEKQLDITNFKCYDEVRKYFDEECFAITKNQYALQLLYVFVNLCEHGVDPEKQKQAMKEVCTHPPACKIV